MKRNISILAASLFLCFTFLQPSQTFASETQLETVGEAIEIIVNSATETKPILVTEILVEPSRYLLQGKKAPTGTSFVDLSNSSYSFNVESMTVEIYTNSLFSGTTTMSVKIEKMSVDKNGMQNETKGVKVNLYKSGSSSPIVTSASYVPTSGGTIYFKNLSTSTNYYVSFSKENDSQIYTFKGTIKQ